MLEQILGLWLVNGCIVYPQFESCWMKKITRCKCELEATK